MGVNNFGDIIKSGETAGKLETFPWWHHFPVKIFTIPGRGEGVIFKFSAVD